MEVDGHVSQLRLDLAVVHTLTGWGDVCTQSRHKKKKQPCLTMERRLLGGYNRATARTLCFHSIGDGAGVAQPVGVGRPHQEEVDRAGLQALQDERLGLHVLR